MKSAKQHYEEWKHLLPNFTEEQKRKLYFMMNDYARDYHESEVKNLGLFGVMESDCDHEWLNHSFDHFGFLQEQICDKCGAKKSVP